MEKHKAHWTYDGEADAYYFAPTSAAPPPYLKQKEVTAIVDVAADGTLAGIEIVGSDGFRPPARDHACDHAGYSFEKHGRRCPKCGVFMVDWGD